MAIYDVFQITFINIPLGNNFWNPTAINDQKFFPLVKGFKDYFMELNEKINDNKTGFTMYLYVSVVLNYVRLSDLHDNMKKETK